MFLQILRKNSRSSYYDWSYNLCTDRKKYLVNENWCYKADYYPNKGRYQAHPIGYWKDEFIIAKEIGLDSIEFILDYNDYMKNPLMSRNGIKEILKIIEQSGVKVRSICADFFMEAPLHSDDAKVRDKILKC